MPASLWLQLLTAKPVVYLVNLSEKDYARKKNKWLVKLFEWVQQHGGDPIIPFRSAQAVRAAAGVVEWSGQLAWVHCPLLAAGVARGGPACWARRLEGRLQQQQ